MLEFHTIVLDAARIYDWKGAVLPFAIVCHQRRVDTNQLDGSWADIPDNIRTGYLAANMTIAERLAAKPAVPSKTRPDKPMHASDRETRRAQKRSSSRSATTGMTASTHTKTTQGYTSALNAAPTGTSPAHVREPAKPSDWPSSWTTAMQLRSTRHLQRRPGSPYSGPTGLFYKFALQQMPARCAGLLAQHKYKLNATNIIKVTI
jgi:hypothetical protein